ncbi:MAG TPA: hypothetical protein VHA14_14650 [Bryobacteraceae bacterium]|jgi:hypothetical protein|nr:hypothetical protein [Bryobacteraceae bacterium]
MRERPIIFSGPMVRAILDGRKTQTRRLVEPVRNFKRYNICRPDMMADPWMVWWHGRETEIVGCSQACRYGKPGDRLWVKETWALYGPKAIIHQATNIDYPAERWRNAMFMPRLASRINLEITSVRAERVQDISEADAKAEGAEPVAMCAIGGGTFWSNREGFRALWDSIHVKEHRFADNDLVWVVEFRVVA